MKESFAMRWYRLCDLIVASEMPLPELAEVFEQSAEWSLQFRHRHATRLNFFRWYHNCRDKSGIIWLSCGRSETDYCLRFHGLADFVLSADGAVISCHPASGIPDETCRHLLLNQVVPFALAHRSSLVLHASAVEMSGAAVAFLGQTGQGKSTMAAYLMKHGNGLITDDCLVLRDRLSQMHAIPYYPGIRLWPDALAALTDESTILSPMAHYTDKKRVSFGHIRLVSGPRPLHRVFIITAPESANCSNEIQITPLSSRQTFAALVKHSYRLDTGQLKQEFHRLAKLASLPIFYRLTIPHDLARLAEVRATIFEHLANSSAPVPATVAPER